MAHEVHQNEVGGAKKTKIQGRGSARLFGGKNGETPKILALTQKPRAHGANPS